MTDAELVELLEQRMLGIASCSTCSMCRGVAEIALRDIAEHRQAREARRAAVRAEAEASIDECADLTRRCGCGAVEC